MERVAVTIGADPEIFVADEEGVVPADMVLPSQRRARWKNNEEGQYSVYRDGMQAEFGIGPSPDNVPILRGVQGALRELNTISEENGLRLVCEPCVPITQESLHKAKDPTSTQFGCAPEKIARYGGAINLMELDGNIHMLRYAGGHFHVGDIHMKEPVDKRPQSFMLRHPMGRIETVICMDLIVGNQLVMLERDPDRARRQAYGKAGTYRETRHGLEYRTPSNLVLRHPAIFSFAMGLVRLAVAVATEMAREKLFGGVTEQELIEAIDNSDKEIARANYVIIRKALYENGGNEHDISRESLALLEYAAEVGTDTVFPKALQESWNLESNEVPTASMTEFATALKASNKDFASFEKAWKA